MKNSRIPYQCVTGELVNNQDRICFLTFNNGEDERYREPTNLLPPCNPLGEPPSGTFLVLSLNGAHEWGLETPDCGKKIREMKMNNYITGYYKDLYIAYVLSPDNRHLAKYILEKK